MTAFLEHPLGNEVVGGATDRVFVDADQARKSLNARVAASSFTVVVLKECRADTLCCTGQAGRKSERHVGEQDVVLCELYHPSLATPERLKDVLSLIVPNSAAPDRSVDRRTVYHMRTRQPHPQSLA